MKNLWHRREVDRSLEDQPMLFSKLKNTMRKLEAEVRVSGTCEPACVHTLIRELKGMVDCLREAKGSCHERR